MKLFFQEHDYIFGGMRVDIGTPPARVRMHKGAPTAQRARQGRVIGMARRALAILEEQAAAYTALTIPVHLKIQLEEKRRQVAEMEAHP